MVPRAEEALDGEVERLSGIGAEYHPHGTCRAEQARRRLPRRKDRLTRVHRAGMRGPPRVPADAGHVVHDRFGHGRGLRERGGRVIEINGAGGFFL